MPSTIVIRKKLDMTPGAVPTVVHRSQYDSDFTIIFELFARTGEFLIESGTTARLRGTKTSGTGYSVPIPLDISTKTVTITGDAQMTVAAGNNIFEVVLYLNDLEICSSNFVLAIERAAMDADTITDETVVPELEHLEEYTQQAAEQAARSASVYAESWAVGGTGTREGEDTNNAKYWSEQAQGAVAGVTSFNGRTGAVVPTTGDYKSEMIRRGNSTTTVEDTLTSLGNTATDLRSRMYTQEGYTSDLRSRMSIAENAVSNHSIRLGTAESDIDALETRATTAESDIDALENRVTTAEGDIDALESRATTAESNITTLQNNKVDMTTPQLNLDTSQIPGTTDGDLYAAINALGWNALISNQLLELKGLLTNELTELKKLNTITRIDSPYEIENASVIYEIRTTDSYLLICGHLVYFTIRFIVSTATTGSTTAMKFKDEYLQYAPYNYNYHNGVIAQCNQIWTGGSSGLLFMNSLWKIGLGGGLLASKEYLASGTYII